MQSFTTLRGVAAPLMRSNIDTDTVIPVLGLQGGHHRLGDKLFMHWRFDASGREKSDFLLNQPRYRASQILVAGPNFGCGSSREAAVWALLGYGIRCVIAPSFGEIFLDNSYQNGLLPIVLSEDRVEVIADILRLAKEPIATIDLQHDRIELPDGTIQGFEIAVQRRQAMLQGLDELDLLLGQQQAIATFRRRDSTERQWIYARGANS